MAATYDKIATTTLSSATTTINFTSIPSSYTDLRIVWVFSSVSAGNTPYLQINGDTGQSYSYLTLFGTGANNYGSQRSSNNFGAYLVSNVAPPTGVKIMHTIDIFNYTASTSKTLLNFYSADNNGSGTVSHGVNCWRSSAAITSVQLLFDAGGNIASGSTATLYGILKA